MVADNPRCDSLVAGKLPENSQFFEASQQLSALPNPPAPIPETSKRVFDPNFAAQIGLLEAIFIYQLHYWLTNPKAGYHKGGVKWIYNGYKEWLVQFPFVESVDILGRMIRKLEKMGLIETGNFNNNPYDRRKWYRIIYEELARRYGWNPLNLPILQESRMDNAAIQNGFCIDTESYTDYPQNLTTENNNDGNDVSLNTCNEDSVTSTVTANESVEVTVEDECRTESEWSPPETTITTVIEPNGERVSQNVISREPSVLPLQTSSMQPRLAVPDDKNIKATSSRNCTENHELTVKPQKPKKVNHRKNGIKNPNEESIAEELDKAGLLTPKLKSLALTFSLEAVQKTLAMLNQQGNTIKNPAGWFTKCLRGKWWKQSKRKKTKPKKSWEDDFSSWYEWAIAEEIVEDVAVNYLSTDHCGEPMVRLAQPDRFSRAPYTLEGWRNAKKLFPMPEGAAWKLPAATPQNDNLAAGDDSVRNHSTESTENRSTSDGNLDTSSGGVSSEREVSPDANESPAPQGCVTHSHPVESITEDNSLDSPPDSSLGGVSRNLDSDDSRTQPSSVMQSSPVEAVNENYLSGSPPDISSGDVSGELSPGEFSAQQSHLTQNHPIESITEDGSLDNPPDAPPGDVSRKVAVDFTEPDWMTFPWEPKNGWQPGTERERSRRHKAEWCRNQLIRVSSDEEMHELFHQLGDCALACLEWVERHLLTPHEIASRDARMEAGRDYEQQSLLE